MNFHHLEYIGENWTKIYVLTDLFQYKEYNLKT
jgi:hypothetical protein